MNIKTLGFGQIDYTGFLSVLKHLAWGVLIFGLYFLVQAFNGHDFGVLTVLSGPLGVFFTAYIKKLAETYSVTLPDTTVNVSDTTGPVSPVE